jgi:hypothetical protein
MVLTILWTTLGILVLFLVFVFLRKIIQKKLKLKICAICAAVGLTWITLLILKWSGFLIDNLLIGILMGESIVGIMYLFEKKIKEAKKENLLWLKVFIILIGTSLVYLLLSEFYGLGFWILLLISFVFLIYILISMKSSVRKKNKWVVEHKYGKFSKEIKKLEEKFEHCCD